MTRSSMFIVTAFLVSVLAVKHSSLAFSPVPCALSATYSASSSSMNGRIFALHMAIHDVDPTSAASQILKALNFAPKSSGRKVPLLDFLKVSKGTYRYVRSESHETIHSASDMVGPTIHDSQTPENMEVSMQNPTSPLIQSSILNLPTIANMHSNGHGSDSLAISISSHTVKDLDQCSNEQIASSLIEELKSEDEPDSKKSQQGRFRKWITEIKLFDAFAKKTEHVEFNEQISTLVNKADQVDVVLPSHVQSTQAYQGPKRGAHPMRVWFKTAKMAEMVLAVGFRDLLLATTSAFAIKMFEVLALHENFREAGVSLEMLSLFVVALRFSTDSDGVVLPFCTLDHLEPTVRKHMKKPAILWHAAKSKVVRETSDFTLEDDAKEYRREAGLQRKWPFYEKAFATLAFFLTSAQASAAQLFDFLHD